MDAKQIIEALGLEVHVEGGYFTETWRDAPAAGGRGSGTAIYYLLEGGRSTGWHRIDAPEVWHYYAGSPLELCIDGQGTQRMGADLARGERPQRLVPAGVWQRARSLGAWTLAGCTVSPAFQYESFELAPEDFEPGS